MCNLKNKLNEQTELKQTRDTESRLVGARREGVGELGKKAEGSKKYKLAVTKQSQGCEVQHRNIVDNIVVTRCGARWVLEISGEHFVKHMTVSNTILYTWNQYRIILKVNCN